MAVWFLALALAALASTGDAIQCYECPKDNHKCGGDGFDIASLQKRECSVETIHEAMDGFFPGINGILGIGNLKSTLTQVGIPLACVKIDRTNQDSGKVTTIRSCTVAKHYKTDSCDALTKIPVPGEKVTFCGICESDLCNAAPGLAAPASLAALVIFSSAVVYLVAALAD